MDTLSIIMLCFSLLGALDRIFGNRLGLGNEFEKAFHMLGVMALSMIGIIVISPWFASLLEPISEALFTYFKIDPSIIPAMIFANDMGGAQLALEIMVNEEIGRFNALIVSSMMGATFSFTIPLAIGCTEKENQKHVLLGLLCGIITIPFGCFAAGIVMNIPIIFLLYNLLPLQIFAIILVIALLNFPETSVRVFGFIASGIKVMLTIGLALGIIEYMTGYEPVKGMASIEEGAAVCLNACITMTGAFPMMYVLSKLLKKPLSIIAQKTHINETSAMGFVSTLATNVTTFGNIKTMDEKGIVLNSAFAVSAAFVFAGHMAFTRAYDNTYLYAMIIGKLIAGFIAIYFANYIYNHIIKKDT